MNRRKQTGAGQRNVLCVVEQASDDEPNGMEEVLPKFKKLCDRWAKVSQSGGREFVEALVAVPLLNLILRLPYDEKTKQITTRDRIVNGCDVYNIVRAVDEDLQHKEMLLWCIRSP